MSPHDMILAENRMRVDRLEAKFQGHNGVDRTVLLHWLRQFRPEDIPLALKLLELATYFTRTNVTALCRQLVEAVFEHLRGVARERVLFVIAGDIWEGNAWVARTMQYSGVVPTEQLSHYSGLRSMQPEAWDALILVKDFSGTGTQLAEWWTGIGEALVLPLDAQVILGVLVLNACARERLEALDLSVLTPRELHDRDNIFRDECTDLSQEEKTTILRYCQSTGASDEYVRGYGGNGLVVAFDYGCPNNSIPLLWHNSDSWSGLFRRHGWA